MKGERREDFGDRAFGAWIEWKFLSALRLRRCQPSLPSFLPPSLPPFNSSPLTQAARAPLRFGFDAVNVCGVTNFGSFVGRKGKGKEGLLSRMYLYIRMNVGTV